MKVQEIRCLTCGAAVAFDKRIHSAFCSEECANIRKRTLIKNAYPPVKASFLKDYLDKKVKPHLSEDDYSNLLELIFGQRLSKNK
mgnify:CR=1 FL=1